MTDDMNRRIAHYTNPGIDFRNRLINYSIVPDSAPPLERENLWDAISRFRQNMLSTNIDSLNDDNREDLQEIEILEEASKIKDGDIEYLQELENDYLNLHVQAVKSGKSGDADMYKNKALELRQQRLNMQKTLEDADKIVKDDHKLISASGHNPIFEALSTIIENGVTGTSIGVSAGSMIPGVGNAIGGIAGGITGTIKGIADAYTNTEEDMFASESSNGNRFENYLNAIKTREAYKKSRARDIEDMQNDLLYWQTKYPVSESYAAKEQAEEGMYAYYNLPGLIGSSFSDSKDLGEQVVDSYAFRKIAKASSNPYVKVGANLLGFGSALINGWQQSLAENHAEASETSTKKAVESIEKNKDLEKEMLEKARKVAIDLYGVSKKEAEDYIDTGTAFMMFQGGIGGLNPKDLKNGYDYYKSARQLGDIGADTQFQRDMMATASGDILEASLLMFPYGSLSRKSKILGRAITGAAIGGSVSQGAGFGTPGLVLGGAGGALLGATVGSIPFARRMWRGIAETTTEIGDKVLPTLQLKLVFSKAKNIAAAWGVTSMAEAAEEGTQYINALDAEKMVKLMDDDINLRSIKNLFVNDLNKRGEVFNAVMSTLGLSDSPYQNDAEFWKNWKGGLILGGVMNGVMSSTQQLAGAKKTYNAAKIVQNEILNSGLATRMESQDAILKGQLFAKYANNGQSEEILEMLLFAKEKNKNRKNSPYNDEDYDDVIKRANRIMRKASRDDVLKRLTDLGYKLGSDEANMALSVNDYYADKMALIELENRIDSARKVKAMNTKELLDALNSLVGEGNIVSDEGVDLNDNGFTYKVINLETGKLESRTISLREKYLKTHEEAARLLAVAQLLKDLNNVENIVEWSKSKGLAFDKSQLERSKASLKLKYDQLKSNLSILTGETFANEVGYDNVIEYTKRVLARLDSKSGEDLADMYRDSTLRGLNYELYTNIRKALAIDTNSDANLDDVKRQSKQMSKMFVDNVEKNKKLQEIIDYTVDTSFKDMSPNVNEEDSINSESDTTENTNESINLLYLSLTDGYTIFEDAYEQLADLTNVFEELDKRYDQLSDLYKKTSKFNFKKRRRIKKAIDNISDAINYTVEESGKSSNIEETEEPIVQQTESDTTETVINPASENSIDETQQLTELPIVQQTEPNSANNPTETKQPIVKLEPAKPVSAPQKQESPTAVKELTLTESAETSAPVVDNTIETNPAPLADQLQQVAEIIPDDSGAYAQIEDPIESQDNVISRLQRKGDEGIRELSPGWYLTKDGRIIPSEMMYTANPTEATYYSGLAEKYREVAARIRYHVHWLIKNKKSIIKILTFVSNVLNIDDQYTIEQVSKAVQNNDQNAIKMLIMAQNHIAFKSFYTNEFFRSVVKSVITGVPVQKPDYIDDATFNNIVREIKLYKSTMENKYGVKFVINPNHYTTKVGENEVVANPDIVAVDKHGNVHLVNVYTINNDKYLKQRRNSAESWKIDLSNTHSLFSLQEERAAYASILHKAFTESAKTNVSSTILLPIVVDSYERVHRAYLGKLIPIVPDSDSVTKYGNQEDLLGNLQILIDECNKTVKDLTDYTNGIISQINEFCKTHRDFKARRHRKRPEFTPKEKPSSIAEAYAQIDALYEYRNKLISFCKNKLEEEFLELERISNDEKVKNDISKEIEEINKLDDESKHYGIDVEIIDGDEILNDKAVITEGIFKASLDHAQNGAPFIRFTLEYKGKLYKIKIAQPKQASDNSRLPYGKKNGGRAQNVHPNFTAKMKIISKLLEKHPELEIIFDVSRLYVSYKEKGIGFAPSPIVGKEGIISEEDINFIGQQRSDGVFINIGFFDQQTGLILTGLSDQASSVGYSEEKTWQNKLFLTIKQTHSENGAKADRIASIPLVRAKFGNKLASFIAQCYFIMADTDSKIDEDSQRKRHLAKQMLHLFIGQRLMYSEGLKMYPNVVYTNGQSVILNNKLYHLKNKEQFNSFVKELQNCEIMPSWKTFNVKFKNLAKSSMNFLYDHFSEKDEDLHIAIDGVDSGIVITKKSYTEDSIAQWLVRNGMFYSTSFKTKQSNFTIHNISVSGKTEAEVKQTVKEETASVIELSKEQQKDDSKDDSVIMTEDEFEKSGLEEVTDEELEEYNDENAEYSSSIIKPSRDYNRISKIKTTEDAIKVISGKYKRLSKLFKAISKRSGMPVIHIVVSDKRGELAIINGVKRTKKGYVSQNEDKSWTITLLQGNDNPIKTLAHEMVHVFTLSAIYSNSNSSRKARAIYSYCKETFTKEELTAYGFKNFKEFIAEFFTNSDFIELLKSKTKIDEQLLKYAFSDENNKPSNIFEVITNFIVNLWNKYISRNDNMYNQVYFILKNVLLDYNGDVYINSVENDESNESSSNKKSKIRSAIDSIYKSVKKDGVDVVNHITGLKIHVENATSVTQVNQAISGIMTEWIKHEVGPLGENIDKINFSTEAIVRKLETNLLFKQWWYRIFAYSEHPLVRELTRIESVKDEKLKSESNPDGFVTYEKREIRTVKILKKDGSVQEKRVWKTITYNKLKLPNWDVITPMIDEFMSNMRIETRKKVWERELDSEIESREDGTNPFGELLSESFGIDPLDRASKEVKWLFSTVPYGEVFEMENGRLGWRETTTNNQFGFNTFMPFKQVYGKVLYYTDGCKTAADMIYRFYQLAKTGPDKAMFMYLHTKLSEIYENRWKKEQASGSKSNPTKNSEGLFLDANVDSMLIKVVRALRQQQNDFIEAYVENDKDEDGNPVKNLSIRTTLYQKAAIMAMRGWMDQLSTGLTGILKYDAKSQRYRFVSVDGVVKNVFKQIYSDLFVGDESFIVAYNKLKAGIDTKILWRNMPNAINFSELTSDDIKTYLHNVLIECGIDVRQEVIDQWLNDIVTNNPTVNTEMDALYQMLSDNNSEFRPINFFKTLAIDEAITEDTLKQAFNRGFIRKLANLQNEYDLHTQNLMTIAPHDNQYYIVSERNYVNDIAEIISFGDMSDPYIQMLVEDSFASGSVVAKALMSGEKLDIKVSTFVGMKTKNIGDRGRDYFEIELNEDIISKLELLHEGYMICPTTSDKKTYHPIKGMPLVGMNNSKSNIDCYHLDRLTGNLYIIDNNILDTFISYFKSERDAVEKAIKAYESKFYEQNPGKKIANYSDQNGMRFSSFNCIPVGGEVIYLNEVKSDPKEMLGRADANFFNRSILEQRFIMQNILLARANEDIAKCAELGLIKDNGDGTYSNIGLDNSSIQQMAINIGKLAYGENFRLTNSKNQETGQIQSSKTKIEFTSAAIRQYITDCSIKHMMSMQEYQRLFSGSKCFYKWRNNGKHVTDISVDYTKRRGGDISTGGMNITGIDSIEGMEDVGNYTCLEIKDQFTESTTFSEESLIYQFEISDLISAAATILNDDVSPMNRPNRQSSDELLKSLYDAKNNPEDAKSKAEEVIRRKYGDKYIEVIKLRAKSNALKYFRDSKKGKATINVADGATYISDAMCEKLLREEGKWDDEMKYAFEVLRGQHGAEVLSREGAELYKSILDVVIGTLKYTATGFRKSDDGSGGTLMTPYYNKTALFPVFDQIAYGKIGDVIKAMRKNNVEALMLTSAVKVGSLGAITIDEFLSDNKYDDHIYVQEMRFLRKQLNTDPNGREEMNLGTQTIKIALANLRYSDESYVDPFTGENVSGKTLYNTIMQCYNILTDIGLETVMRRFTKKDSEGNSIYFESKTGSNDFDNVKTPLIDEKALHKFLHEELMSRDANDNMFDAIALDDQTGKLAAPISAISQSGWIDSILASYISKQIIDTKSPGAAYIQRSVFCMEGDGEKMLNEGKDLKLVNEEGSMDSIISIDFFENVIPNYKNLTFEQAREWLIKHKLIGKDAKTYTISYRIPTQAQSSINALKFVDVVPIIKHSIILPKDFTTLTGSDFDIDKLFLSRLYINEKTLNDPDKMFKFYDDVDMSNKDLILDTLKKGFTNKLFLQYLTLLMDKNSANTNIRPIDSDTDLFKDVYDDLYPESSSEIQSMSQDTIAYQTEQKNNFVVGKIGIGPFALNNNNHIYTMIYGISIVNPKLKNLGEDGLDMTLLCRDTDIYGESIMSWLSGGINAHVDIAKDPFITKLNINKYTYNICMFLLRAGFGKNGLWFLNLPVIKELCRRQNAITGEFLKSSNKTIFEEQEEVFSKYKEELFDKIPESILNKEYEISGLLYDILGKPITLRDLLLNKEKLIKTVRYSKKISDDELRLKLVAEINNLYTSKIEKPFYDDLVLKDKSKSMLYKQAKGGSISLANESNNPFLYDYMSVIIFEDLNKNAAKTVSDLTKYTKIDTKKHGSTMAALLEYLRQYNKFLNSNLYGGKPKISGNVLGLFGILYEEDATSLNTNLNLSRSQNINTSGLYISLPLPVQYVSDSSGNMDITETNFVSNTILGYSFIHNKTLKAINAMMYILQNESIEATLGFRYIWSAVINNFEKSSITEDMLKKLRSIILGAIKNRWAIEKMKDLGIDPISLFEDTDISMSLAHELVKLKSKHISYIDKEGKKRFGLVADKYKNNALLNLLFDGHAKDEYSETDAAIKILDFIKVHVPFTDDSKKSNDYIRSWQELYDDEVTREFSIKLMFYSLLTSNDQGGNNLFKWVPFSMLKDFGLFANERSYIDEFSSVDLEHILIIFKDLIDEIQSVVAQDFDFNNPIKIESYEQELDPITGMMTSFYKKQYIGFGYKFGNTINTSIATRESDRIPYIFIPVTKNYDNYIINKNIPNRPYIRIYNPIVSPENPQRFLVYKKIVDIFHNGKTIPMYKLVDSSVYSIGQYKIYNYGNKIDIASTAVMNDMRNRMISSTVSLEQLDSIIKESLEDTNGTANVIQTLNDIYDKIREEDRCNRIRNEILSKYNDNEYLKYYIGINGRAKSEFKEDLNFVFKHNEYFSKEELDIAFDMLTLCHLYDLFLESTKSTNKPSNTKANPLEYHIHSGGAYGSDFEWTSLAIKYGMPNDTDHISHYYYNEKTPYGNTSIQDFLYQEGMSHVITADLTLNRLDNIKDENRKQRVYSLLARNWIQVKNSDGVFAIGKLNYGKVDGGAGWAVLMAIDVHKIVHVFDLNTRQWYKYDYDSKGFVVESTPKLTKNFAAIGTRSIDPEIEQKTSKLKTPVKYIGDDARNIALKAMEDVFKNTFGGKSSVISTIVNNEIQEVGSENVSGTIQSMNSNENPEFTEADNNLKAKLGGNPLKVVMASEHTDPAFHSKRVCQMINEDLKNPKGKRKYHMLQIMTKHDGLPLLDMLELNIPKSVHFSITSLGGTKWEPGVMKADDLLDRIEDLINRKKLNPATTTIRIDPIIPGVSKQSDIEHIILRANSMGIRSFKVSIMDSYSYNEKEKWRRGVYEQMTSLGYDFSKYYSEYSAGVFSQDAKPEVLKHIYLIVDNLAVKYNVNMSTCGEKPANIETKRIKFATGCLNAHTVSTVLNVSEKSVEEETKEGTLRPDKCHCLNNKIDILTYNDSCASCCAYYYAGHGTDSVFNYYNEDGTLKDNAFTQTFRNNQNENVSDEQKSVANIPLNLISGTLLFGMIQHASDEIKQILGDNPYSIDMIEAGFRTRTTRSASEMQKYGVKEGDIVTMFGKSSDGTTKQILARITAIYGREDPRFKDNWSKEGWTEEGLLYIDRFKSGAKAIEFEVIKEKQKSIKVSKSLYTDQSTRDSNVAVVFTENALAEDARRNNTPSSSKLKTNVSAGRTGTNQAVVRMIDDNTYAPNAFGIIVKKYQQTNDGAFVYDDSANFQDTQEDFEMFKKYNSEMFKRLKQFAGNSIVFPKAIALGKAALPYRFAEWLANKIYEEFGLFIILQPNSKYNGKWGIVVQENQGTINVYSGEYIQIGSERYRSNHLSNFDKRNFKVIVSKNGSEVDVTSVELAFLLSKLIFAYDHGNVNVEQFTEIWFKIMNHNINGAEIKKLGRNIPMSAETLQEWNIKSYNILKYIMKQSFNKVPGIKSELLRTGNSEITHNNTNGNPIDEGRFSKILKEIRLDFKNEEDVTKNCN